MKTKGVTHESIVELIAVGQIKDASFVAAVGLLSICQH